MSDFILCYRLLRNDILITVINKGITNSYEKTVCEDNLSGYGYGGRAYFRIVRFSFQEGL